jgi:hypothetical protein
VRGHVAFTIVGRIGDSLLLEVPTGVVTLHEVAPRRAHRANDDFLALKGGSKS